MSADPSDDTNALLLHLVTGGTRNITSEDDLPSASFSPASGVFSINILFSLSLTLALLAAFLAVLGQQWLVYYQKRSGGGADAQRWEQLRRYLGAKRWRLEAILDDVLPSLLQLGLVIFCTAFALYLGTLSRWICYAVAAPMGLALACILFMAISAALDQWCPFKSPLSRTLQLIPHPVAQPAWHTVLTCLSWAFTGAEKAKMAFGRATGPMTQRARQAAAYFQPCLGTLSRAKFIAGTLIKPVIRRVLERTQGLRESSSFAERPGQRYASNSVSRIAAKIPRPAEPVYRLNAIAVKRILCTSEDANALIYAAANLQTMESLECIEWLLSDEEVYGRLWEGVVHCVMVYLRSSPRVSPGPSDLQALKDEALHSAFIHLVFYSGRVGHLLGPHQGLQQFPPASNDDPNFKKVIHDLQYRVYVITLATRYSSVINRPSTAQLGLLLMGLILSPSRESYGSFDRWFKDHALLSKAPAHGPDPARSLLPYLLVWAVHGFTKIKPPSNPDEEPAEQRRLESLSKSKEYAEWSLRTTCDIMLMYRQR